MKTWISLADMGAAALKLLPPETAHRTTLSLLGAASPLLPAAEADDPRLAVDVLGLRFGNPIGLAAGFDKDAIAPDAMARFGFGFVECGTVTPKPQIGNARPRLFRLKDDHAVVNRMGFNNQGMDAMAERLARRTRSGIRRHQYRGEQRQRRSQRRLSRRLFEACAVRILRHRQCLVAEHAGPARSAKQKPS